MFDAPSDKKDWDRPTTNPEDYCHNWKSCKEEKCENCKFFSYVEEEGLSSDGVKRGDCRRHPPNQHGVFSETQHDYFCGEFKGRE
jgi:hypothetical protein